MGCGENTDQKKLGEAQACLDRIPQSDPTSAQSCMNYIASVKSPQADALRCSIGFLAGGITTNRLIEAVKKIDDGDNAEQVFISLLVFNGVNLNDSAEPASSVTAIENVNRTTSYCNKSGVKGLMYLSNFAVVGTALMSAIKTDPNVAFWESPTFIDPETEAADAVNTCSSTPENCSPAAVGAAIIALSDSYCKAGQAADDKQCQQVKAAIAAGGGDPEAVAAAFFAELNK